MTTTVKKNLELAEAFANMHDVVESRILRDLAICDANPKSLSNAQKILIAYKIAFVLEVLKNIEN